MLTVRDLVIPAAMLRCVNPTCRRLVSPDLPDCPWCGTSLAFAQTHTFQVFFRMTFATVALALLHALLVFPALLAWFGPPEKEE